MRARLDRGAAPVARARRCATCASTPPGRMLARLRCALPHEAGLAAPALLRRLGRAPRPAAAYESSGGSYSTGAAAPGAASGGGGGGGSGGGGGGGGTDIPWAVGILRTSLQYERGSGCNDAAGASRTFSQFARATLDGAAAAAAGAGLPWELQTKLRLLAGRFDGYGAAQHHEREQLLTDLEAAVTSLEQASAAPAPSRQQQGQPHYPQQQQQQHQQQQQAAPPPPRQQAPQPARAARGPVAAPRAMPRVAGPQRAPGPVARPPPVPHAPAPHPLAPHAPTLHAPPPPGPPGPAPTAALRPQPRRPPAPGPAPARGRRAPLSAPAAPPRAPHPSFPSFAPAPAFPAPAPACQPALDLHQSTMLQRSALAPSPSMARASALGGGAAGARARLPPAWQLYYPPPRLAGAPGGAAAAAAAAPPGEQQQQQQQQQQGPGASAASSAPSADASGSEFMATESLTPEDAGGPGAAAGAAAPPSAQQPRQQQEEGGAPPDKETVWEAFVAFARQDAARRAAQRGALAAAAGADQGGGGFEQRSDEWHALRRPRLTASALPGVMGWFGRPEDKGALVRQAWAEKVGLAKPPAPNEAMTYGTNFEDQALESYERLMPQHEVHSKAFSVWAEDDAHTWLGASPDGLISQKAPPAAAPQQQQGAERPGEQQGAAPAAAAVAAAGGAAAAPETAEGAEAWMVGSGDGVLEIKCPYKASPGRAGVLKINEYYMHQVQTLMAIHDREWCNLFYWSEEKGSCMAHIKRDREYWALLYQVMADFWWRHVVPARIALEHRGMTPGEVWQKYSPRDVHPYAAEVRALSAAMLKAAPKSLFDLDQTRGADKARAIRERREAEWRAAQAAQAAPGGGGGGGGGEGSSGGGALGGADPEGPAAAASEAGIDISEEALRLAAELAGAGLAPEQEAAAGGA